MSKFKMDPYQTETPSSYPTPQIKELFEAIRMIETPEEAANFFRDLLTMSELTEFANRWQMVKMLSEGAPYLEIAQTLGVSTTTVARVAHWLNDGFGGYQKIIGKINAKKFENKRKDFPKNDFERTVLKISKLRK
jgi:TrpR-related protein YerC/YecD